MNITKAKLDELQKIQFLHDSDFHSDIIVLGINRRMAHITLHLAKYLKDFLPGVPSENFKKSIVDTIIMITSAANLLGLRLNDGTLCQTLNNNFFENYVYLLSKLAKATESADHQEDYPIRNEWNKRIIEIFHLVLKEMEKQNINVFESVGERLKEIERKSFISNLIGEKA